MSKNEQTSVCGFVIITTKNTYVYCICWYYEVLSLFFILLIIFLWIIVYDGALSLSPDFYAEKKSFVNFI